MLASSHSSLRVASRIVRPGAAVEEPRTLSTLQMIDATGATARQLQWWDEQGCVSPAREGHQRIWSMEDGALCCICARLRQAGDSLQKVRKILRQLRVDHRIRAAIKDHSDLWVIIGKKQVNRITTKHSGIRFAFSTEEVAEEMRINDLYFILIPVHDIISRLELV